MMTYRIPVVDGTQVRLRGFRMKDFDAYAEFYASDRACHVGGPMDRRTAWSQFASDTSCWQLRGYGMWAVETQDTGELAGWVGIVEPAYYREPELGWMVRDGFEGRGIAHDAALAARDYANSAFDLNRLASFISAGNSRSIRLAERLGATCEDTRDRGFGPYHVYRHPAEDAA